MSNRQKGKRGERYFANLLKEFFPEVRRNAGEQAQQGGVDLLGTEPFDFEIKFGKAYKSKLNRDLLDQIESEGKEGNFHIVLVKPDHEKPYVLMPFVHFQVLLALLNKAITK
jgi:Holliday junction resolvase